MIDKIRHFALTHWMSVHDEEAMTALELQGRTAAKLNEVIDELNQQGINIRDALDAIPDEIGDQLRAMLEGGTLSQIVGVEALRELGADLDALERQIDQLVLGSTQTDGNAELIDARSGYTTLGDVVRKLITGDAFEDAVRPGTVKGGRIFAGMLGGDLAARSACRYTIPMAGHWTGGNAYYSADLERMEHNGYNLTDMIPCKYGDAFELDSYIFGGLVYPAAVFNSAGVCVEVLGDPGEGDWVMHRQTVTVGAPNAAYISFVCGTGYVQQFRAVKLGVPQMDQPITGGYWRLRAKNRTDTITDRAQIRCSFPLTPGAGMHSIPVQILRADNVKGITCRIFAALGDRSYETQLPESAAAYSFDPSSGIMPVFDQLFTETGDGVPYTHVCLFLDFLAADPAEYMDVWIAPPQLDGTVPAVNPSVHGGLSTDTLSVVAPAAAGSPAYGKRVLGMGDSLMRGNTLPINESWFSLAAGALGMTYYNAGVNGSPVAPAADSTAPDSMRARIAHALTVLPAPDYFVLTGGANDKRLNVPLDDFRTALVEIIDAVRASNPACKILLGTNWRRTSNANSLGLTDSDYVVAMLEVAEQKSVHSFNNYSTGINLLDPAVAAWADEGLVSTGTADLHFSREANRQIADKYRQIISGL